MFRLGIEVEIVKKSEEILAGYDGKIILRLKWACLEKEFLFSLNAPSPSQAYLTVWNDGEIFLRAAGEILEDGFRLCQKLEGLEERIMFELFNKAIKVGVAAAKKPLIFKKARVNQTLTLTNRISQEVVQLYCM